MKKYTDTHEWVQITGTTAEVGISQYAQKELGEVVYIELPEVGCHVKAGDQIAVLESTKAASDVYTPVSGKILEVNILLKANPQLINLSPEKEGWIYRIECNRLEELQQLTDSDAYQAQFIY
ncbi:MAG: glycine cleavage system protein GcvH [Chlamydiales bacterium]